MSGPQDFLTRWSRRKQEAAAAVKEEKEAAPLPGEPEHAAKDEQASTAIEPGVGPSEPLFDPKSLPPIEYGAKPKEDQVAYLVRAGAIRLRLEFPMPHYESHFDIMELRK